MTRIIFISLFTIALCTVGYGQSGSQLSAKNFDEITSVTAIPLSDTLAEGSKPGGSGLKNKSRDAKATSGDSSTEDTNKRYWASAEFLLWRMKDSDLPPLITVGPTISNANPNGSDGVIGLPGTVIVFGGKPLDRGKFPGGRFTAGLWLNEERNVGIEVGYFFLKTRTFRFQGTPTPHPT